MFTLCTYWRARGIYPAMLYWSPGTDVTGVLADLAERLSLRIGYDQAGLTLAHPDGRTAETWREGYPYPALMSRAEYAGRKRALQLELLKVQEWVKATGQRVEAQPGRPGLA